MPIAQAVRRINHEQARRVARLRGPQRDALLGKMEVEQVDAHGR